MVEQFRVLGFLFHVPGIMPYCFIVEKLKETPCNMVLFSCVPIKYLNDSLSGRLK